MKISVTQKDGTEEEHDLYDLVSLPSISWTPQPWRKHAKCLGMNIELFFDADKVKNVNEAKKVCGKCPVQRQCLEWACVEQVTHGVFGGRTPRERRHLRKGSSDWLICGTKAGVLHHEANGEELCPACKSADYELYAKAIISRAYYTEKKAHKEQREQEEYND